MDVTPSYAVPVVSDSDARRLARAEARAAAALERQMRRELAGMIEMPDAPALASDAAERTPDVADDPPWLVAGP